MKKNKLKNYLQLGIFLFGISFLLLNCKEEDFQVKETQLHGLESENTNIVRILSIENIPKLKTLVNNIKKIEIVKKEKILGSSSFLNNIENLNTEEIAVYTDDTGYSTYTFKFNNPQESINFENLYLLETESGGYISYILNFEPNEEWYNNNLNEQGILNFKISDYQGDISKYSLERELIWTTKQTDNDSKTNKNSDTTDNRGSWIEVCTYSLVPYDCGCNCECYMAVGECETYYVGGGTSYEYTPNSNSDQNGENNEGGGGNANSDPCNNAIGTPITNDQPLSGIGGGCAPNSTGGATNTPPTPPTCTGGKILNTATNQCECPDGKVEDSNGNCIDECPEGYTEDENGICRAETPCDKIQAQLNNLSFKTKLDSLKTKTNLHYETGYSETADGTFNTLSVTNSGHSLNISIDYNSNKKGFMHTHIDDYLSEIDEDGDGIFNTIKPIRIFSPNDIRTLLIAAFYSTNPNNTYTQEDAYGVMVSSDGDYMLKFSGNIDDISNNTTLIGLTKKQMKKLNRKFAKKVARNDLEKKTRNFLRFIKNRVGINGLKLFKLNNDGSIIEKKLNQTNDLVSEPCQ